MSFFSKKGERFTHLVSDEYKALQSLSFIKHNTLHPFPVKHQEQSNGVQGVRLDHCASVVHMCLGMFGLAEMRVQSSVLSQRHSGQRGGGLGLARHDGVKLEDQSGPSICHTPGAHDTIIAPSPAVVFMPLHR